MRRAQNSVSSVTAAPSLGSPSWPTAGRRRAPSSSVREMTEWICWQERGPTLKSTFRPRQPATKSSVWPAEAGLAVSRLRTGPGSSPGWWPARKGGGKAAMAWSGSCGWSPTLGEAALPGRSLAPRVSPVAAKQQNRGWKPEPAL